MHFDNELLFGKRRAPKIEERERRRERGEQPVNFPLYDHPVSLDGRVTDGGVDVDGGRV